MKYRRVFDGQRMRFVDPTQHTIASCECLAPPKVRVGIPEPHSVEVITIGERLASAGRRAILTLALMRERMYCE